LKKNSLVISCNILKKIIQMLDFNMGEYLPTLISISYLTFQITKSRQELASSAKRRSNKCEEGSSSKCKDEK
jgi:ABC-type microcin C transport system permease subunit YejE